MTIWTIYLVGVFIALMWYTHDYYMFNLRNGRDMRYFLNDTQDVIDIFIFSLGSWLAVIWLAMTQENE